MPARHLDSMIIAAIATTTVACADPCVDDGINQSFCPAADTESATEGASASATEASATAASMTASATGATDSMSAGSMTAGSVDGTGASVSATAADDTAGICPVLEDAWENTPPTFVLLVDQSGSMTQPFDGSTRWETLGTTLLDPTVGAVATFQDKIRFGMSLYTNTATDPGCPELTETTPMLDAFDDIEALFAGAMPEEDTPTGDAITAVTAELVADGDAGEKVIVLVTDGEPDTCAMPNPQNGQEEAIAATAAAHDMGIRTVVVSVGADVSATHLQDVANAGAGVGPGDPDAEFYVALDQPQLASAFQEIIFATRPCNFDLSAPLVVAQADNCVVQVNGAEVPFDASNGWQTKGDQEIQLLGTACDDIQTGAGMVEMTCDCSAVEGGG